MLKPAGQPSGGGAVRAAGRGGSWSRSITTTSPSTPTTGAELTRALSGAFQWTTTKRNIPSPVSKLERRTILF